MPTAVITGVSTGIGYAVAAELLRCGWQVLGSVRRPADGEPLQKAWGEQFTPLLFDVTDPAGILTAVAQTQAVLGNRPLEVLINNAGVAVPGPLLHFELAEVRQQFEVNVFGLLAVTQAFAPLLGATPNFAHSPGRIINISSVSGQITYPFMGVYSATKHAVEAFSDALRRELLIYGVDVIVIEPGTVKTPIIGKFAAALGRYTHTGYAPYLAKIQQVIAKREESAIPVERVVQVVKTAVLAPRPRTRYPVPRQWLTGWLLPRWLPDRWLDMLSGRELGLKMTQR